MPRSLSSQTRGIASAYLHFNANLYAILNYTPSSFSNNNGVRVQSFPGRWNKVRDLWSVYDACAGYFPSVCLVCGGERGLHTLARLMYGIPRRLTPIIETHRRAPLAAHYPTVVTLPCPRTLFLGVFLFALLLLLEV